MGLIGAVGGLGGLGINLVFREAFASSGSGTAAFVTFLGCYAVCCAVTWAVYLRRLYRHPAPGRRGDGETAAHVGVTAVNRTEIRRNRA